jgi:hypothetical protein
VVRARPTPNLLKPAIPGVFVLAACFLGVAWADTPSPAAAPAQAPNPAPAPPQGGQPAPAPTTTGRILGRVTDAGKPIQGAQVRLLSRNESGLLRVTSSDQRGEYRFKELPSGTYDVEVEVDGFRQGAKPGVEVKAPFQNIVDVPMSRTGASSGLPLPIPAVTGQGVAGSAASAAPEIPPVTVRGVLLDGDRHPVVDVSVLLVPQQGTKLYQTMSGPDGAFRLDGVVPGRYRAVVRSPGHMPVDLKSVEVKPEAGLTLNLSLVDFPLNFKTRAEGSPPPETPRPLPGSASAPAAPPVDLPTGSSRPAPPPAAPPAPIEGSEKRPPAS